VCDKGIEHARNEDAMALSALPDGSLAVLVVCDGVTSAPESDKASLAASRAACAHLGGASPPPPGSSVAALVDLDARQLGDAAAAAHAAAVGVARTLGDPVEPPSCTFVAAVVRAGLVSVAWVGDSRAYWLPDGGAAVQLSVDHSVGTELVRSGLTRAEAESDPAFHTITRWLGADSVEPSPELTSHPLDGEGWVVLCSDGLWNYASDPAVLAGVVGECRARVGDDPLTVCAELVRWANGKGGHDNITVAVAAHTGATSTATSPTGTLPGGG
jgi:serine/threonine protein phosphatase PrpC